MRLWKTGQRPQRAIPPHSMAELHIRSVGVFAFGTPFYVIGVCNGEIRKSET